MSVADALALLGLAQRAGALARGTEATRQAVQAGRARLVVLARDASRTQLEKIARESRTVGFRAVTVPTRAELGSAVGAGPLSAVAVTRASFAKRLLEELPAHAVTEEAVKPKE